MFCLLCQPEVFLSFLLVTTLPLFRTSSYLFLALTHHLSAASERQSSVYFRTILLHLRFTHEARS